MSQAGIRAFPYRVVLVLLLALLLVGYFGSHAPGTAVDEATKANRAVSTFAARDDHYFDAMDGGAQLTAEQRKGRIGWLLWTGGNDRFWDAIARSYSFGAIDLLKTVSSYPSPDYKFSRDNRWSYLGLVNEPCFEKATGPDPDRFGLWLDKRSADCSHRPLRGRGQISGRRHRRAWQEPCPSVRITAMRPGLSDCAYFPIRTSMRKRRASGIRSATTRTQATTVRNRRCVPIAWVCPAPSAISARTPRSRRPTTRSRNGRT